MHLAVTHRRGTGVEVAVGLDLDALGRRQAAVEVLEGFKDGSRPAFDAHEPVWPGADRRSIERKRLVRKCDSVEPSRLKAQGKAAEQDRMPLGVLARVEGPIGTDEVVPRKRFDRRRLEQLLCPGERGLTVGLLRAELGEDRVGRGVVLGGVETGRSLGERYVRVFDHRPRIDDHAGEDERQEGRIGRAQPKLDRALVDGGDRLQDAREAGGEAPLAVRMAKPELECVGNVVGSERRAVVERRVDQGARDRDQVGCHLTRLGRQVWHGVQRVVIAIQRVVDELHRELGPATRWAEWHRRPVRDGEEEWGCEEHGRMADNDLVGNLGCRRRCR